MTVDIMYDFWCKIKPIYCLFVKKEYIVFTEEKFSAKFAAFYVVRDHRIKLNLYDSHNDVTLSQFMECLPLQTVSHQLCVLLRKVKAALHFF